MTSNRTTKHWVVWSTVLISTVLLAVGCGKQANQLDHGWSPPVKVTESQQGFVGGVIPYKWHDQLIAFQVKYSSLTKSYPTKCFLLDRSGNSNSPWIEKPFIGVPDGYVGVYPDLYRAIVAIDKSSDRVFFEQGYMEDDQLVMNVLLGRMTGNISVQDVSEKKWMLDAKALFGETQSIVRLTERTDTRDFPELGIGVINGSEFYIPYCVKGFTYNRAGNPVARGPNENGVFHSSDSGDNWQIQRISDSEAWLPTIVRTKDHYYYFATGPSKERDRDFELWFAQKPVDRNSWGATGIVTKTFVYGAYGQYAAVAEGDTVHVCWMDVRHKKQRYDIGVFPPHLYGELGNCEIAYCQRKDSDADWSQSVILSKGLVYSYSPSMSVEGNKIIIAWASPESGGGPNDIFYVTSKDGGETWTNPLKVSDDAKDGKTAGQPAVMLLNGVIHLFYIQGALEKPRQISPGLTKLNQPPWPIYYQQRPFPN
jgi:hypothetical protein